MMNSSAFKRITASFCILFLGTTAFAGRNREAVKDSYGVTVLGVYDYSKTFSHQGGVDIAGHMPFHTYIEADAGFEFLGPKILAGTLAARPKLPLKVGELFLDAAVHLRAFNSFEAGTFALAASLGYRMDYVSVQMGIQRTVLHSFRKAPGDGGSDIVEPVNPIFRIAFNVRPCTSPWNISFGAGNFTLYKYERFYYPIFFLGGHVDITSHLTLQAEVDLQFSGIFNMTAHFNELTARAGLTYNF